MPLKNSNCGCGTSGSTFSFGSIKPTQRQPSPSISGFNLLTPEKTSAQGVSPLNLNLPNICDPDQMDHDGYYWEEIIGIPPYLVDEEALEDFIVDTMDGALLFSNGLTKDNSTGIVKLGGDLTGSTYINGEANGGFSGIGFGITMNDSTYGTIGDFNVRSDYNTGQITLLAGAHASNYARILMSKNENSFFYTKNTTGTHVKLSLSSNSVFEDTAYLKGLSYGANYASANNANPRWIVDKGYVDGAIAAAGSGATFTNGLTKTGNIVKLGGTLIDVETYITGDGVGNGRVFGIYAKDTTYNNRADITLSASPFAGKADVVGGQIGGWLSILSLSGSSAKLEYHDSFYVKSTFINLDGYENLVVDNIALKGLSYGDDYSANNLTNPLWIPHKGWISSNFLSSGSLATNAILNQNTSAQTANAWITGTLEIGGSSFGSQKLSISGTNAAPLASGAGNTANGSVRVFGGGTSTILDLGAYNTGDYTWIQSRSFLNYSLNKELRINPNGGNVSIGGGSATHALTMGSVPSASGFVMYNTADQTTNYERVRQYWSGNIFNIVAEKGGTGISRVIQINSNVSSLGIGGNGTGVFIGGTSNSLVNALGLFNISTSSGGFQNSFSIISTINQSGTAGYRGLWISPFEQTLGSGVKYLIDAGTNSAANGSGTHTSKFTVDNQGILTIATPTTGSTSDQILVRTSGGEVRQIASTLLGGGIQNQNTSDQTADFRITGVGETTGSFRVCGNPDSSKGFYLSSSLRNPRWLMYLGGAESSGNAGSSLLFARFTDAGTFIDTPFVLSRLDGSLKLSGGGEALKVGTNTGLSDNAFIGLYARTATPTTQTGRIGYLSAGTSDINIQNLITNGNIGLSTVGSGADINFNSRSASFVNNTSSTANWQVMIGPGLSGPGGGMLMDVGVPTFSNGARLIGRGYNGTSASRTAITSDNPLLTLDADAYYDPTTFRNVARIRASATELHSSMAGGSKWEFYTTANGTVTQTKRLVIDHDGSLIHTGNRTGTPVMGLAVDSAGKLVETTLGGAPPDLSGYVTLGTPQTITGAKTFSAPIGGNLGIGVSPTEKLHVAGNGLFTGMVNALGIIARNSVNNTSIELQASAIPNIQAADYALGVPSNLKFQKFGGNIAIGDVTPTEKLHVAGNGLFEGKVRALLFESISSTHDNKLTMMANVAETLIQNTTWDGTTPKAMSINPYGGDVHVGGNMTILGNTVWHSGNSNLPTVDWKVLGLTTHTPLGSSAVRINNESEVLRWSIVRNNTETGGNTGSDFFITAFTDAGGWLNDAFIIKRVNGNVGIGIDPTEKLHVEGNILATGSITAYNTLRAIKNNASITAGSYDQVNMEVRTTDGSAPAIGFYRAGTEASTLYFYTDNFRHITAGGALRTFWDSGNLNRPLYAVYELSSTAGISADALGQATSFSYAYGSPWSGPIISFGGLNGNYDCQLNASYNLSGTHISFRTKQGDLNTWNSWFELYHSGNFSYAREGWSGTSLSEATVGYLKWRNYGNNHIIFDASASLSPAGTSVNPTNAAEPWTSTYPTLMGWNGSMTYGVRVDTARYAESTYSSSNVIHNGNRTDSTWYPIVWSGTTSGSLSPLYSCADVVIRSSDASIRANYLWLSSSLNTAIYQGPGSAARIATAYGHVDVGPQNSTYSHFNTDRPAFYFGSPIEVNGNITIYGTGIRLDTGGYVHATDFQASGGWFRNTATGTGLYNVANNNHFMSEAANTWAMMTQGNDIQLRLATNGGTTRGYLYADYLNDVGFLTTSGAWRLRATNGGDVYATEFYRSSTRKGKENIQAFMGSALDIVRGTKICTYTKKLDRAFGIGFIAEDTHEWLSGKDRDGHNFGAHLAILTKAVQEEDNEIQTLKKEVAALKARVAELEGGAHA